MSVKESYNIWAGIYDSMGNKTRDLEKTAALRTLREFTFDTIIEIGCGTGKNTEWLLEKANLLIGMDFSEEMLSQAKQKIKSPKVQFVLSDITKEWNLRDESADLISCSLVLEHISDLNFIFKEAYSKLRNGGRFYVCELHPFKQYGGTKARYETENGVKELEVYVHHISDFTEAALQSGFSIVQLKEWFDEDKPEIPRLISFLFEK